MIQPSTQLQQQKQQQSNLTGMQPIFCCLICNGKYQIKFQQN